LILGLSFELSIYKVIKFFTITEENYRGNRLNTLDGFDVQKIHKMIGFCQKLSYICADN